MSNTQQPVRLMAAPPTVHFYATSEREAAKHAARVMAELGLPVAWCTLSSSIRPGDFMVVLSSTTAAGDTLTFETFAAVAKERNARLIVADPRLIVPAFRCPGVGVIVPAMTQSPDDYVAGRLSPNTHTSSVEVVDLIKVTMRPDKYIIGRSC